MGMPSFPFFLLSSLVLCYLLLAAALAAADAASESAARTAAADKCSQSFASADPSFPSSSGTELSSTDIDVLALHAVAFLCPANCSQRVAALSQAAVLGSFPYYSNSSLCLAAIHAGIVSNAQGGAVYFNRFYAVDWSNSSTQTIFPHNSSSGTLSNGVQSADVDSALYGVPSNASEWSYAVRGRGDFVVQRRIAPFSPRAGHLHAVLLDDASARELDARYRPTHLILGGRNATHYLNDVWVGVQAGLGLPAAIWWSRLQDAPFTLPRADMSFQGERVTERMSADGVEVQSWTLLIIGGETGYACGLRELSICSNELWELQINRTTSSDSSSATVTASWAQLSDLPFTPRCEPWTRYYFLRAGLSTLTVVGGQLSYSDSNCSTAPRTVNDVWIGKHDREHGLLAWSQLEDAPFSPRRVSSGGEHNNIAGGIRHENVSRAASGELRLLQSVVLADIWSCWWIDRTAGRYCDFRQAGGSTSSMAVGGAALPSNLLSTMVSGVIASSLIRQWQLTPPLAGSPMDADPSQLTVNITTVLAPLVRPTTEQRLLEMRLGLPLSAVMGQQELDDKQGNYQLGAAWMQGWSGFYSLHGESIVPASTAHYQPEAFVTEPDGATIFVPQPASSRNSSRPALNFSLRRIGHRSAPCSGARVNLSSPLLVEAATFVSGGQSGLVFNNDLIYHHFIRCLPPDDPSFLHTLGPVRIVSTNARDYADGSFLKSALVRVSCPSHYHLEPPALESEATLRCQANGIWSDDSIYSIRRCAPDRLHCRPPLADLGNEDCEPEQPVIQQLLASYDAGRKSVPTGPDKVTIDQLPVSGGVLLTIIGNCFLHPVVVTVNGAVCSSPVLLTLDHEQPELLCYNVTVNGSREHRCDPYGREVSCSLQQPLLGLDMVVRLASGALGQLADVDPLYGSEAATLSSTPPIVQRISSDSCQSVTNYSLVQCPVRQPFSLNLCAKEESVGTTQVNVLVQLDGSVLNCQQFQAGGAARQGEACAVCSMLPKLDTARLRVRQPRFGLVSAEDVTVAFQPCPAGFTLNYAAARADSSDLCLACPAGWSTNNISGAHDCSACAAGQFSSQSGSALCTDCPIGWFSPAPYSTACRACSVNSYQINSRQTRCEACELNEYIVYASRSADIAGQCAPCPAWATCLTDGNITASSGVYILIDQSSGSVSTTSCSFSACLDGRHCIDQQQSAQHIRTSNLSVINCCGPGRWPSYDADEAQYRHVPALYETGGHNVLCAACLPGHTEVNGRCIPCASTQYGLLVGVLLLGFVLVYLVHRLPHDWTGSATLLIVSYFLQQSMLFMASEATPQLLTIINFDLLGSHVVRGYDASTIVGSYSAYTGSCIVPLDDVGQLLMSLASPLIAAALLAALALLHLAARGAVRRTASSAAHWLYTAVFVPSPAKVLPSGDIPVMGGELHFAMLLDDGSSSQRVEPAAAEVDSTVWLSYQRSLVRLLQLSYTGLTVATLSFFHLQSVGEFGRRLVEFPSLSPDSALYRSLLPVVLSALLLLVCGLPLSMTAFLLVQHCRGNIALAKERQGADRLLLSSRQALLLQLCAMFRLRYWWMASVVLLRRLVLVAVLVSVRDSSVWPWLTLVNYCLLFIHVWLQPYERRRDNTMESLTLLSLTVQTTLLTVWPPPFLSPALLGVLSALVLAPLIPITLPTLRRTCRIGYGRRAAHLQHEPDLD